MRNTVTHCRSIKDDGPMYVKSDHCMARWIDNINNRGCAPGVSELCAFTNLKNYSWRPLKHGHIRSIICLKDHDVFGHPPRYRPLLFLVPESALARRRLSLGRTNERTFAGHPP